MGCLDPFIDKLLAHHVIGDLERSDISNLMELLPVKCVGEPAQLTGYA